MYKYPKYVNKYDKFIDYYTSYTKKRHFETLYPVINKSCTALLLIDLATPEWISVDCNEKMSSVRMCQFEADMPYMKLNVDTLLLVKYSCIVKNGTYYLFDWLDSKMKDFRQTKRNIVHKISDVKKFEFIFQAIHTVFPPIILYDLSYKISYSKVSNVFHYKMHAIRDNIYKGLIITKEDPNTFTKGGNIFECENKIYISMQSICDMIKDCPYLSTDEYNCNNITILNISYAQSNVRLNNFIQKNHKFSNHFIIDNEEYNKSKHQDDQNIKQFCNTKLPTILLNDLVQDCNETAEDEFLFTEGAVCLDKYQIPCREGHPQCFNISEICTYRLNYLGHLLPCRTGEHLENCVDFDCSKMFKCSGFYCIPYEYVCDGKWDCPYGVDESKDNNCSLNRNCTYLFKCRISIICIHVSSICDGIKNCPLGDDEKLCSLHDAKCPQICSCFTYTIKCTHGLILDISMSNFPYQVISLRWCSKSLAQNILNSIKSALSIIINNCNITEACYFFKMIKNVQINNAGSNLISTLQEYCFSSAPSLKIIILNNNKISKINTYAFINLESLRVLDLSNNLLQEITFDIKTSSGKIDILSLIQNNFLKYDPETMTKIKINLLLTDDSVWCCLKQNVVCSAEMPWFTSCTNLLHSYKIWTVFIWVAVMLFIINITNLIPYFLKSKNVYLLSLIALNLANLLYGIYLTLMIMIDRKFADTFPFFELQWKSTFYCYLGFGLSLNYHILSAFLLLFLTSQRYIIMAHPFNTMVKSRKLISSCIVLIVLVTVLITLTLTIVLFYFSNSISHKLCSPLFDPSKRYPLISFTAILIIFIQMISLILIITLYVKGFKEYITSANKALFSKGKVKQRNIRTQIFLHIICNMLTWIPNSVISSVLIVLPEYPLEILFWQIISITTINPIVLPLVLKSK